MLEFCNVTAPCALCDWSCISPVNALKDSRQTAYSLQATIELILLAIPTQASKFQTSRWWNGGSVLNRLKKFLQFLQFSPILSPPKQNPRPGHSFVISGRTKSNPLFQIHQQQYYCVIRIIKRVRQLMHGSTKAKRVFKSYYF